MKKRLLYVLHSLITGGAEMALLSAIPVLNEQYELMVIILGYIDEKLLERLSAEERKVFIVFKCPSYLYPFRLPGLMRKIAAFNPDIMVTSLWRSAWVGLAYKRKKPSVHWFLLVHNTRFFHFPDYYFYTKAFQHCEQILVDSAAAKKFVQSYLQEEVPIKQLSMLTDRNPAPVAISVPDFHETIRFVFVGRIHRQKNLPLAIAFLALLKSEGYKIKFDIIGRADGDEERLRKAISKHQLEGDVNFLGEKMGKDKEACLRHHHFYLQFSEAEGMGMSVIEAMQQGIVCLVTPVGEISQYSKHGLSALWLQDNNLMQLATEVKTLLQEPRKYEAMAIEASQQFLSMPIFSETLMQHIEGGDK